MKRAYTPAMMMAVNQAREDNVIWTAQHLIGGKGLFEAVIAPHRFDGTVPLKESSVVENDGGISVGPGPAYQVFAVYEG